MGSDAARKVADEVRRRRRAAAVAGHEGDATTARSLLGDPDGGVRERALGALARMGAADARLLAGASADPDPRVRRRVAELEASGHGDGATLEALLGDADPTVVEVAAWAAGEREDPAPIQRLADLARHHDDPLVREAAVAALGAIGDPGSLPTVLEALGDRATVRRRAVIALAAFEGPEVDRALEAACADRDWQVRQVAEDLRRSD
ncbi:MAG: HEAT repeat domain-containing protein [Acidimicrobiia bacterium]|nr:HEAT repeat domain-containing protein [Acidimicrobiia bacterium]